MLSSGIAIPATVKNDFSDWLKVLATTSSVDTGLISVASNVAGASSFCSIVSLETFSI